MGDPTEIPADDAPAAIPQPLEPEHVRAEVHDYDEADKKMLPCHKYVIGSCDKGITCLFYHPAPEDLPTAITSPPFPEEFGAEGAVETIVRDIGRLNTDNDNGDRRLRGRTGFIPRYERYGGSQGRSVPTRLPPVHRQFSYRYHRPDRSDTSSLDRNFPYRPYRPSRATRPLHYVPPSVPEYEEPGHYIDHYLPPVQPEEVYIPPLMAADGAFNEYEEDPYDNFGFQDQQPAPPFYDDYESDTMFKHIEWSQFLAPGQVPPPVVAVPAQYDPPVRKQGRNFLAFMMPPSVPEGSQPEYGSEGAPVVLEEKPEIPVNGKMSAKQELKFKVGLIAMELSGAELETEEIASHKEEVDVIVSVPEFTERIPSPVAVQ